MARKAEGSSSGSSDATRSVAQLKALRGQIDKLDVEIVKLVNQRADLAAQVGRAKREQGEDVFAPAREEEVYKNVVEASRKAKGQLDENTLRAIFREIMSGSRALQKILKVAYLGPEYSFSHLATVEHFGQSIEFVPVSTIAAVFEEVHRGHVDYGVVPVENSTDGRVADTLDMFVRMPHLQICGEVRVEVHHNLVANCEHQEIRRIYSKPQALSQCRNWLSKNVPHAKLADVGSTAIAAELASREPGAAAVASREAAVRYGLRVLFDRIEDMPNNETRFAVIGHHRAEKTGKDKTAVMFRLPHNPGALVDALAVFKANKINLTWIESYPAQSASAKPEYLFFVDFEGHIEEARIEKAVKAIEAQASELHVLGAFPQAGVAGG
ncbi:MAG: prephenate dehydratase [Gemmataceae bacterium]|nr:prephenate dehydratase [Gemmataceae bacterium]